MNYRLAIAGTIAACFIAGTGASVAAAGTGGSAGPDKAAGTTKALPPGANASSDLADVAHDLGVTEQQLLDALPAAKQASVATGSPATPGRVEPDATAAAASLAGSLHVSQQAAEQAFAKLITGSPRIKDEPRELPDAATVAALASFLHISSAQAKHVWDELSAGDHGMEPTSAEFAAVAESIGMTPAQLQGQLRAFKSQLGEDTSSSKAKQ